jgi:hypothetical protein
MNIKNLFRRKEKPDPQPLRIQGIAEAPLTAEPDDAELAAQALLEMMSESLTPGPSIPANAPTRSLSKGEGSNKTEPREGMAEHYHRLAERIRQAQEAARLRTMRFVAFCEEELKKADLPLEGPGSLGLLNVELMKRIDTIERVGGELKTRWQHCVAQVLVRLMKHLPQDADTDSDTDQEDPVQDKT